MYRRGSMVVRVVMGLVLLAVLAAVGGMIFRAGQAQGYAMGLAANSQSVQPAPGAPAPVAPYGYPGYYPGFGYGFYRPHFFSPFGPLLGLLFFFTIIMLIGGFFRRRMWGYGGGPFGRWYGGRPGPYPWGGPPGGKGQPREPGPDEPREA